MSLEEKRVTLKVLLTLLGITCAAWSFMWGWSWVRMDKVEARQTVSDITSADIRTQLSQIQTDLKWLINKEK
jgi:hypothetical protein